MKMEEAMAIEFEAAMTEDEFTTGELFHLEADTRRRIAMNAGLTKSSEQLLQIYERDAEAFLEMISLGDSTLDHFQNLMELLTGAVARLSSIATQNGSIEGRPNDTH